MTSAFTSAASTKLLPPPSNNTATLRCCAHTKAVFSCSRSFTATKKRARTSTAKVLYGRKETCSWTVKLTRGPLFHPAAPDWPALAYLKPIQNRPHRRNTDQAPHLD